MPSATNLQFDGRLSDFATQYRNEQLIADEVLPRRPVMKKTGTYKTYTKKDRFSVPNTHVGEKSVPNEVDWSTSEATYTCKSYGLQDFLSNEDVDNADAPITPQRDTVEFLTDLVSLDREQRVAALVMNPATYPAANKVDKNNAWDTAATATPVTDIFTGIDACFRPPNIMVMPITVWRKLQVCEQLIQAIKGTIEGQFVREEDVARFFGLEKVLIGGARINDVNPGATESYTRLWATTLSENACALLRVSPNPGTRDVVFGASFNWKQRQVMTTPSTRGAFGGQEIRVVESIVEATVATDVGYLIYDTIA